MNFIPIGKALSQFLRDQGLDRGLREKAIFFKWSNIVGEEIASVAKPFRIRDKVLYVKVSDPVWRSELQYMIKEINEKIVKEVGRDIVSEIILR